jgi:hypothetical protein
VGRKGRIVEPPDDVIESVKRWLIADGCVENGSFTFDKMAEEVSRYLEAFLHNVVEIKLRKDVH